MLQTCPVTFTVTPVPAVLMFAVQLLVMLIPQVLKLPSAKSFRTALADCEERVSAMKVEMHSPPRPIAVRSMPPSKNVTLGNVDVPSFDTYCHGTVAPTAGLVNLPAPA